MSAKKSKAKSKTLKRIGLWATVWWAVSGVYLVLLAWATKAPYTVLAEKDAKVVSVPDWWSALGSAYRDSSALQILLAVIVIGWLVIGWVWLRELKRRKISYRAAFKDLFLTIR